MMLRSSLLLVLAVVGIGSVHAVPAWTPTVLSSDQSVDVFYYWVGHSLACELDIELLDERVQKDVSMLEITSTKRTFRPPYDAVYFDVDLDCELSDDGFSYTVAVYWAIRIEGEGRMLVEISSYSGRSDKPYDLLPTVGRYMERAVRYYSGAYGSQ